jgi:phosphoribosyl-ATP pyrophosphohydrolase
MSALERLAAIIEDRRGTDPEASWTAKLLAAGPEKAAEKFGEEAVEAIIEAVKGDRARLTAEAADVLYHLLVMLATREVTLAEAAPCCATNAASRWAFWQHTTMSLSVIRP